MSQISYAFDVDLRYTGATSIDHFNWLVNRFEDDTNYTRPKETADELATLTPQELLTFIQSSMGNDESGMAKRLEIKVDPTPQGQVPVPTLEGK